MRCAYFLAIKIEFWWEREREKPKKNNKVNFNGFWKRVELNCFTVKFCSIDFCLGKMCLNPFAIITYTENMNIAPINHHLLTATIKWFEWYNHWRTHTWNNMSINMYINIINVFQRCDLIWMVRSLLNQSIDNYW